MLKERIAKRIAQLGYCSRRQAEELIIQKRVKVNDKLVDTPVYFVAIEDNITIDNKAVVGLQRAKIYLYYKPTGYICSNSDEQGRKTIFDNLSTELPRLIYVGRLDMNSEGLLILTTSGAVAHALSSPSLELKRSYKVRVSGLVKQNDLEKLALGTTIDGIVYKPIIADLIRTKGRNSWLEITLIEGKNREIRHICESLGLQVNRLIRISFGAYNLQKYPLSAGDIIEISPEGLKKYLSKELFQKIFPPLKIPKKK